MSCILVELCNVSRTALDFELHTHFCFWVVNINRNYISLLPSDPLLVFYFLLSLFICYLPFEFCPCYLHCFLVTLSPVTLSLVLVTPVQTERSYFKICRKTKRVLCPSRRLRLVVDFPDRAVGQLQYCWRYVLLFIWSTHMSRRSIRSGQGYQLWVYGIS